MRRLLPLAVLVLPFALTFCDSSDDNNNIITRGKLFQEAKDRLEHGQWLPWLEENFHMTDKTAERAMAVARFADKFDNLSNLDLP